METKAILFVDDEPNILSALRRELRDLALETGLEIRTAPNAIQALEELKSTHEETTVIVSDLKMPEMKGSDFLLRVRELYPDIVTILLTGFSEPEEVMKAVKAGIHSYILKPWEPAYLRSEIEKAMELFNLKEREKTYKARVADELRWAGEMQRALLKPNLPRSEASSSG
jgi:sigma-B regulation protein RsbU (phosphoserine phosphatase)